jgi:hypothetical protein
MKAFLIATCWMIAGVTTLSAGGVPVRIAVDPDRSSILAGASVDVKIELRDALGNDADAPKDLPILLVAGLEGGGAKRQKVLIKAGTDSTKVSVPFYAPGIYLLKATHPYLREGAAHVRVKPSSGVTKQWLQNRVDPFLFRRAVVVPASFQPSTPDAIEVQFHYSDEGSKLIANGIEKCKIMAYLSDDAPFDIRIRMTSPSGSITPNPIVIEKGDDQGSADVVSSIPGDVDVQFVDARPAGSITVTRGGEKRIHFAPPISRVRLTPSPPSVMLGRTVSVRVELTDNHNEVIPTERELDVALNIEEGSGDFEPRSVRIARGEHGTTAQFTPATTGTIKLCARTFGAETNEPTVLEVSMPVLAMILTITAGLIGGLFAAARTQPITRWKLAYSSLAGIAAAFFLYAACQTGLVPKLPPPATVNFFGATMIGLVGGWLGTEAFNTIVKMTGIPARPT